jgi:hypothetical protein
VEVVMVSPLLRGASLAPLHSSYSIGNSRVYK